MSLTQAELIKLARRTDPEGLKGWSDAQVLSVALRDQPELKELLVPQSSGELMYEKYGAGAAAGFGKRFAFQFETQWDEMKAGAMGMMPWTPTEAAESARRFSENLYKNL